MLVVDNRKKMKNFYPCPKPSRTKAPYTYNEATSNLCLTNKTKIYGSINNRAYYQIAEIKRCLRAHTIKSSEEMLQNLIAHKRNSKAKASANVQ